MPICFLISLDDVRANLRRRKIPLEGGTIKLLRHSLKPIALKTASVQQARIDK